MSQSIVQANQATFFSVANGTDNYTLIPEVLQNADTIQYISSVTDAKVVVGIVISILLVLARLFTRKSKLPPGVKNLPKLPGIPWVGRFWGIPISGAEASWHFAKFHESYGPIYEWKTFGVTHVWLATDKIARDLLVSRGKKYGDRHELPAAVGIRGGSEVLPLMGYGENFRRHKNFVHTVMRKSALNGFYEYPVLENKILLRRILDQPDMWSGHLVNHCARVASRCAWGTPEGGKDLLRLVPELLKAVSPEGPLPNLLPFLQHLPESISPFKKMEAQRKATMQEAFYRLQQHAMNEVAAGTATESWSKIWIDGHEKGLEQSKLSQHEAAHAVGTNAFVAIATIGSPLHCYFTAMCHYPSWQIRMQEEIDRVTGDRVPTMKDMPNLPVTRAVIKETLRWRQPTPLGVPHITLEDDVYDGYYIPKGAMIHANHFLISRDEVLFPDPHEFRPERWLESSWPTYKEPLAQYPTLRGDTAFGYGARACTGIDLVENELYTTISALAWAFNISRCEGRRGYDNPVPWYETNPFVITIPKPFACDIKVRSEEKRRAILTGLNEESESVSGFDKKRETAFLWEGLLNPTTPGSGKAVPFGDAVSLPNVPIKA